MLDIQSRAAETYQGEFRTLKMLKIASLVPKGGCDNAVPTPRGVGGVVAPGRPRRGQDQNVNRSTQTYPDFDTNNSSIARI